MHGLVRLLVSTLVGCEILSGGGGSCCISRADAAAVCLILCHTCAVLIFCGQLLLLRLVVASAVFFLKGTLQCMELIRVMNCSKIHQVNVLTAKVFTNHRVC